MDPSVLLEVFEILIDEIHDLDVTIEQSPVMTEKYGL